MTVPAAPWQLDRLSTAARDAAVKASVGAGISLSSWLARLISDTCSAEGAAEPSKILGFRRDSRDRMPLQPVAFHATPMVVAPVSAFRPLGMPLKVPEG